MAGAESRPVNWANDASDPPAPLLAGLALLLALPATSAVAQTSNCRRSTGLRPVAQATAPDRIEVRWGSPTYTCTGTALVKADAAFTGATMALPKAYRDEFRRRRNLPQELAPSPARPRPAQRTT
ncbi:hypothetical protein [Enterobacter hormaechei]|uniref:hypothetical protein n=1 Tax=Enterobacter hormaechei TaxID=158836 RepID=UPI00388ED936